MRTALFILLVAAVRISAAQTSPHGELTIPCRDCHATDSWDMRKDASFRHETTGFPLKGKHASVECQSCHEDLKFSKMNSSCTSCHTDIHNNELGPNCVRCHSMQSWKIPDMMQKHQQTRFPLLGRHATTDCQACHARSAEHQYTGVPTTCVGCHREDFQTAQSPNHIAARFSTDCQRCHDPSSLVWGRGFDHNATAFPLTGAHRSVACASCHQDENYKATPTQCRSCHDADFARTTNPAHGPAGFSHDCQTCHTTIAWQGAQFDHARTRFPLTGAHQALDCSGCHGDNVFTGKSTECFACHAADFTGTTNPNHVANGFPQQCQQCHSTLTWQSAAFDHNATRFPLTGAHATTTCLECHTGGNYQLTYSDCYQCHQTDFAGTTNPNHVTGNFNHNCTQCHTTLHWSPATFDHNATRFALTGAHATAACQTCHTNGNYQLTYTDCYQCHQADFARVTNPNHVAGNFSHNCTTCHTTVHWTPGTFNHDGTGFPLTGAHVTAACQTCHTNGNYQLTYTDCYQCHQSDFAGTTNPNHVTGNFNHDCTGCHNTTHWQPATFNHASTNFPLTGAHVTAACQTCHTNGNYQLTYTNCYQCHQTDFTGTTNPNHVTGNFNHDCTGCHNTTHWQPATFNHATTNFPLTGAHATAACQTCHTNGNYQLTYTNCYQCHQSDFTGTTNPNHVTGNFNHDCTGCHNTTHWQPATFNHATTNFPLTGAHATAACQTCHTNGNYQLTYTNCYQCHQSDFTGTTNPNHVTGNFNHDCTGCHNTSAWQPATFNHATTNFPLTGAHATAACQTCHTNGNYQLTYTNCYQCHQTDFTGTTNPNHVTGNFNHDCTGCHNTSAWQPATFNHATTNFPLTGAHATAACQTCHTNGNYQLTYTNCYQCHQSDFTGTTNPNHVTGNFNHDCTGCHNTTHWQPATFNHATTNFPLTGAHATAACQTCHTNGNYQLTYTNCYQCHQTDFTGTTNPNHVAGNFNHDCTGCHSTTAWQPATFNHATTNFPLTGAHTTAACQTCHVNGNYQLTYTNCYQCHQSDFTGTTNPNHVAANFNHDCTGCHNTTAWQPSTFNHSNTPFPLTGAHQAVACNSCHVNNQYQNLPTACYDCHTADFNGATNPNHVAGNFSHTCTQCHTTTAWQPATFNHATTNFPLTGAHVSLACQTCHVNGNYQLQYSDCYQCHQTDFQQVTNPNHVSQIFPHDCTQCHSTSVWSPNTMNHDGQWFRIYSGHHRNRWTQCSQCHTTPGNLTAFSCTTGCHQNAHHQGQNCYSCHRNA